MRTLVRRQRSQDTSQCLMLKMLSRKSMANKPTLHFFGFRGDEYNRAKLIWGEPDFIHPVHDRRAYVEFDPENDIGIFAGKERPDVIRKYRREYHDMKIVQNSADKGSKK